MKKLFAVLVPLVLAAAASAAAQTPNSAIEARIRELKTEKSVTLTYDAAAKTSKLMAVAPDFGKEQHKRAGVDAMNFGMAVFFAGDKLEQAVAEFRLTFWVLNKKPRFADAHAWTATASAETIDLGDARYAANKGEQMEYLNFIVSRENLTKIAASEGKFKLGGVDLQFAPEHLKLFDALLKLTAP